MSAAARRGLEHALGWLAKVAGTAPEADVELLPCIHSSISGVLDSMWNPKHYNMRSSQENLVNGVEGLFGSLTAPYGSMLRRSAVRPIDVSCFLYSLSSSDVAFGHDAKGWHMRTARNRHRNQDCFDGLSFCCFTFLCFASRTEVMR